MTTYNRKRQNPNFAKSDAKHQRKLHVSRYVSNFSEHISRQCCISSPLKTLKKPSDIQKVFEIQKSNIDLKSMV